MSCTNIPKDFVVSCYGRKNQTDYKELLRTGVIEKSDVAVLKAAERAGFILDIRIDCEIFRSPVITIELIRKTEMK